MPKKPYTTTNFHIAVWLMMNKIALQNVIWNDKRRAEFTFKEFPDRDILINDFFKQKKIQDYISCSTELKARMYAIKPPTEYDK